MVDAAANDANADAPTNGFVANKIRHIKITIGIVTAYISNNSVRPGDLPVLIAEVHAAVSGPSTFAGESDAQIEKAKPAAIKRSITPEALISFIDGKPYKALKRHLAKHGLDFDAYRARYGLPADYPTVSANYSVTRTALAKKLGLGKRIGIQAKRDIQEVMDRT